MNLLLANRTEAGKLLASKLASYANTQDTLVLALPRGGVPVAFEIAKALKLPLDIWLVRKLGVPQQKELAMGAIAQGGVILINHDIVDSLNISETAIKQVADSEWLELNRRDRLYRGDRPFPLIENRTIILVDDGIATGATVLAAITAIKKSSPSSIVVATPIICAAMANKFKDKVDEIVALIQPESLNSISVWYQDFSQTSDEEVGNLLAESINFSGDSQTEI